MQTQTSSRPSQSIWTNGRHVHPSIWHEEKASFVHGTCSLNINLAENKAADVGGSIFCWTRIEVGVQLALNFSVRLANKDGCMDPDHCCEPTSTALGALLVLRLMVTTTSFWITSQPERTSYSEGLEIQQYGLAQPMPYLDPYWPHSSCCCSVVQVCEYLLCLFPACR